MILTLRRLLFAAAVVLSLLLLFAPAATAPPPDTRYLTEPTSTAIAGCPKAYSRATFHRTARRSLRTFPYTAHERRTLGRVIRCQAYAKSVPIVRHHLRLYKHGYRRRFRFHIEWAKVAQAVKDRLAAIASCESGGNPRAISPGGKYRGKYQFDYGTWGTVGGSGDPAAAPEREQDARAARLYRSRGAQPWPVCGR